MRGRALILVVALLAGTAANWKCVWSCWEAPAPSQTAASRDTCHRSENRDVNAITAGESCGPEQARLAPFVKVTSPATVVCVVVHSSVQALFPGATVTRPTFVSSDPSPPGVRTAVPLRI